MGNSKTITVSTENGPVEVRKMPLADYAELLGALDNLPKNLTNIFSGIDDEKLKSMSNMELVGMLPSILAQSWSDVVGLVAVPTDKDAAFLMKLDFADAVDIVVAIVELNDFPRIIESVKKMLALKSKLTRPQKQS